MLWGGKILVVVLGLMGERRVLLVRDGVARSLYVCGVNE